MKAFYFLFTIIAMASAQDMEESSLSRTIDGVINLSSLMNSNYAALAAVMVFFVVLNIVLGARYFGDLTIQKRRRQAYLRRYYQNQPAAYRRYNSRIGSFDYENEDPQNDIESNVFQSLDLVDTTFGLLNVKSEACRERAICELERTATQNVVTAFLTKNLNSYVSGLERYENAIQSGRSGQNCEEIFTECPTNSLGETWKLFKRR